MEPTLFLGVGVCFLNIGTVQWFYSLIKLGEFHLPGVLPIIFIGSGVFFLDIYLLKPSASHTLRTLFTQYMFIRTVRIIGTISLWHFNRLCKHCAKQQKDLLLSILERNKNAKYAKHCGLDHITTLEQFRSVMPLTTETDYKAAFGEINDGSCDNICFPGEVVYMGITSGTTSGRSKYFPKGKEGAKRIKHCALLLLGQLFKIPGLESLTKWVDIKTRYRHTYTKSGVRRGPLSEMVKTRMNFILNPDCEIYTEAEAIFIALVFSLCEDVSLCAMYTCSGALTTFEMLKSNWESICDTIHTGYLPDWLNIAIDDRQRLTNLLQPNPTKANQLREEFKKGFQNIIPRIWPSCRAITALKTGPWKQQLHTLRCKYIGNHPVVSLGVASSESNFIGLNLDPGKTDDNDDVTYVMAITMNFYEFIPEENIDESNPRTLLAHELLIGTCYEVVLTSPDGLYRYRTADVIQVTGYRGTNPEFKYNRRKEDVLRVAGQQVPVNVLSDSLYHVNKAWEELDIVRFTTAVSTVIDDISGTETDPPCLVIFVELEGEIELKHEDLQRVDEELCQRHDIYADCRRNSRIGPIVIKRMRRDTFLHVKDILMNPETYCLQYKLPLVLKNEQALKYLLQNESYKCW